MNFLIKFIGVILVNKIILISSVHFFIFQIKVFFYCCSSRVVSILPLPLTPAQPCPPPTFSYPSLALSMSFKHISDNHSHFMPPQYMCPLNDIYHPYWLVQWSNHCSHKYTLVHSWWLPDHINVMQTIPVILIMAGLFLDRHCISCNIIWERTNALI